MAKDFKKDSTVHRYYELADTGSSLQDTAIMYWNDAGMMPGLREVEVRYGGFHRYLQLPLGTGPRDPKGLGFLSAPKVFWGVLNFEFFKTDPKRRVPLSIPFFSSLLLSSSHADQPFGLDTCNVFFFRRPRVHRLDSVWFIPSREPFKTDKVAVEKGALKLRYSDLGLYTAHVSAPLRMVPRAGLS